MVIAVENRLGYELKRAQQALRLALDRELRELVLTAPQYAALAMLEEESGLSNAELARRSFVTPQTMNVIVGTLEARGLVERDAHPNHGRILTTRLTQRGRSLVDAAHEAVLATEARMTDALTDAQQRQLSSFLRSCANSLSADPDPRRRSRNHRAGRPGGRRPAGRVSGGSTE